MLSKLRLSLAAALALSAAPGFVSIAHASPIPTSTDEARARSAQVPTVKSFAASDPATHRTVSSTDEARALAISIPPVTSGDSLGFMAVTSTDEARSAAGAAIRRSIEKPAGGNLLSAL